MQNQSRSSKKEKNNYQSVTPEAIYQEEHTHEILYSRYKHYKQSYRTKRDLHYHNHPECGYCKNGDGLFFVEDRIYPVSAGTVVFFPAGMNHIAQSPAERNSIWEYIWFDNKALDLALPPREIIIADRDCGELFRMMGHEIQKNENGNFELINLSRHLYNRPDLMPDALHPNEQGAEIIAKQVYSAITDDFGGLSLPAIYSDNMVVQQGQPFVVSVTILE